MKITSFALVDAVNNKAISLVLLLVSHRSQSMLLAFRFRWFEFVTRTFIANTNYKLAQTTKNEIVFQLVKTPTEE